jgi:hypothetical protein
LCWSLISFHEYFKKKNYLALFGYIPHLDDGVLLNMSPLWEIVLSWQKEPKQAWEALEKGEFDWAYQTMDHWPNRVKENANPINPWPLPMAFYKIIAAFFPSIKIKLKMEKNVDRKSIGIYIYG